MRWLIVKVGKAVFGLLFLILFMVAALVIIQAAGYDLPKKVDTGYFIGVLWGIGSTIFAMFVSAPND